MPFRTSFRNTEDFEQKVYLLMCKIAIAIAGVGLVFNTYVGLYGVLTFILGVDVVIYLALYFYHKKHTVVWRSYLLFLGVSALGVSCAWLWSGGILGATPIIFPTFACAILIALKVERYWFIGSFLVLHILVLYAVEKFFPEIIKHYPDAFAHEIDVLITTVTTVVFMSYIVYSFKEFNASERQNLLENKVSLEATNKELEKARKQALKSSEIQSQFLANMSHEIRTPLNGIIGASELLSDTGISQEQDKYIRTINHSGRLLLNLVNDILDLSKIEADKVVMTNLDFSFKEMIEEIMAMMSPRTMGKDLEITYDLDPTIPELLNGDRNRIEQILNNLLSNAIKFTEEGKVLLKVKLRQQEQNVVNLDFEVRDTGIGIPMEQQKLLFTRFYQANATSVRKHTGTGLGLVISKSLIQMMGGSIAVESEIGVGSVFRFNLMLKLGQTRENRREESWKGDVVLPIRILVAEDNAINQMIITTQLKKMGYNADVVENGKQALDRVTESFYDLVFMDVQMPELDGIGATQQIRKNLTGKDQPIIIALTANAMKDDRLKCLNAGMNDYLSKPFSIKDLQNILNKWF